MVESWLFPGSVERLNWFLLQLLLSFTLSEIPVVRADPATGICGGLVDSPRAPFWSARTGPADAHRLAQMVGRVWKLSGINQHSRIANASSTFASWVR